ncbi:MAG: hypothetical protein V7633_2823 [Pseudonocardia sp.]
MTVGRSPWRLFPGLLMTYVASAALETLLLVVKFASARLVGECGVPIVGLAGLDPVIARWNRRAVAQPVSQARGRSAASRVRRRRSSKAFCRVACAGDNRGQSHDQTRASRAMMYVVRGLGSCQGLERAPPQRAAGGVRRRTAIGGAGEGAPTTTSSAASGPKPPSSSAGPDRYRTRSSRTLDELLSPSRSPASLMSRTDSPGAAPSMRSVSRSRTPGRGTR